MRTTSSLESVNSTLGRSFPKHPHIFKFLDCLRLFEFSKLLSMIDLVKNENSCQQFQRKRQLDKDREEKINFFTNVLNENRITVREFLEAMANKEILQDLGKIYIKSKINCYYVTPRIYKYFENFTLI